MTAKKPQFRQVTTPQAKPAPVSQGRAEAGKLRPATAPAKLDPRAAAKDLPPERGGYDGPEPTRYGDWEHKGRATDF